MHWQAMSSNDNFHVLIILSFLETMFFISYFFQLFCFKK